MASDPYPALWWERASQLGCILLVCVGVALVLPLALAALLLGLPLSIRSNRLAGRWLPLLGLLYFGTLIPLLGFLLAQPLWEIVLFTLWPVWFCFPVSPVSYFFRPRLRRAAFRAMASAEQEEVTVDYCNLQIDRSEPGRTVVTVRIQEQDGTPGYRRYGVADSGEVEPLSVVGHLLPPPVVNGPTE